MWLYEVAWARIGLSWLVGESGRRCDKLVEGVEDGEDIGLHHRCESYGGAHERTILQRISDLTFVRHSEFFVRATRGQILAIEESHTRIALRVCHHLSIRIHTADGRHWLFQELFV